MYGDGGFGVGLVVVLVDVGEHFVEDVGVQFLEVDVLRLSFLRLGEKRLGWVGSRDRIGGKEGMHTLKSPSPALKK